MFATVDEVKALLGRGKSLVLAGEEDLLRAVPQGSWIGGTIPYFMTEDGGRTSRERIFVQPVPTLAHARAPVVYGLDSIAKIGDESPDNGYTILILPAFSAIHQQYALEAPQYHDLFLKTIGGWISGMHLDDIGKRSPLVFDGTRSESFGDKGVALHVELPNSHRAELAIVNIFEPSEGDVIQFPSSGFSANECTVNGETRNFCEYFSSKKLDSRLPLVADFCGALINVSIRELDTAKGEVQFYAPIFQGVSYRLARPVGSYPERFSAAIPAGVNAPAFSCNCVLNYLYGELEHKKTGLLQGPMTFGEIAFQLLNQTLVHITVSPVA